MPHPPHASTSQDRQRSSSIFSSDSSSGGDSVDQERPSTPPVARTPTSPPPAPTSQRQHSVSPEPKDDLLFPDLPSSNFGNAHSAFLLWIKARFPRLAWVGQPSIPYRLVDIGDLSLIPGDYLVELTEHHAQICRKDGSDWPVLGTFPKSFLAGENWNNPHPYKHINLV